jgi:hypothetical protein
MRVCGARDVEQDGVSAETQGVDAAFMSLLLHERGIHAV